MHITFELSDGRHITAQSGDKIHIFKPQEYIDYDAYFEKYLKAGYTHVISIDHIITARPATPEEIRRYDVHGQ